MLVNGKHFTAVWMEDATVYMIEQNLLPFEFKIFEAKTYQEVCFAIKTMITRGAGCVGAAAAFGMAQAFMTAPKDKFTEFTAKARKEIEATRPTAKDLFTATKRVFNAGMISVESAVKESFAIHQAYIEAGRRIGEFGSRLIKNGFKIETHCNAGWLGLVDWGSALAPVYTAFHEKKDIFVWVDETRPRGQGARLTAWELKQENIPHKIVPDNAGAYLMSNNMVDIIFVGADRIAQNGDAANKIGTFEKAIVAKSFGIPFYICAPLSTFDFDCSSGKNIPIEERDQNEVLYQSGVDRSGNIHEVLVCSPGSNAINPAFDVTPAEYITGIITEKGIIKPCEEDILSLLH
ncbi:MAG: S-methyl-5-thioribose-1-phosphate isomerase [Bacteroidales bacterium]|jgi:S-methyl-5-thioribose-1-phosphate isomerase|nr:S-methyl-5-thioribose-1-phosphate isomerase [Bacteroidales bacterium]